MRLLLIEDDRELVKALLKPLKDGGYVIDVAEDGVEGEYLGNENIYDMAILDLGLPKRNGLEVLNNWRNAGNKLPVIILTARDTWQERVDGFKTGADDYLGKPFHVEELMVRISALLHRSAQSPGHTLRKGSLSLDQDRQTVTTADGKKHQLTGTEFRLLRYFILNAGQVLSKSRLTDHLYNLDSDKDSNVIEAYIKRLRKILGKECIETHRGQGYVFKESSE